MRKTLRITGFLLALTALLYVGDPPSVAAANPESNGFSANLPGYPEAMAVNPSATEAYVLYNNSHNSGKVSTISLANGKLIGTIPIRANVTDLALNPDGSLLYLTSACDAPCDGSVHVLDTKTDRVVATIDVGSDASTVAVSPDGRFAFVTNAGALCVINTADERVISQIPIDPAPTAIAVSPTGSTAYVATEYGANTRKIQGTLEVVNIAKATVVASVDEGGILPFGLAANPNGKSVYVSSDQRVGNGTPLDNAHLTAKLGVRVLDTKSNSNTRTIETRLGATGIAFSSDGKFAYVAEPYVGIDEINANTNRPIRIIRGNPGSSSSLIDLVLNSNNHFIYATASSELETNGRILKIKI